MPRSPSASPNARIAAWVSACVAAAVRSCSSALIATTRAPQPVTAPRNRPTAGESWWITAATGRPAIPRPGANSGLIPTAGRVDARSRSTRWISDFTDSVSTSTAPGFIAPSTTGTAATATASGTARITTSASASSARTCGSGSVTSPHTPSTPGMGAAAGSTTVTESPSARADSASMAPTAPAPPTITSAHVVVSGGVVIDHPPRPRSGRPARLRRRPRRSPTGNAAS